MGLSSALSDDLSSAGEIYKVTIEAQKEPASSVVISKLGKASEDQNLAFTNNGIIAREQTTLSWLQDMSLRLVPQDQMGKLYDEFVGAAVYLMHSDFGNMQILDSDGNLRIVAYRGFERQFLDFFTVVASELGASCCTAESNGKRVIVEDITKSPIFIGTPSLKVLLAAGVRACQSTPLVSRSGKILGIISTHYRKQHVPEESELCFLDILARQAADLIEQMRHQQELESYAKKLEELVKERTTQLELALENEKRHRKEAVLLQDILTHDIRNYNQVTRLTADLLSAELKEDAQAEELVKTLLDSVRMTNELLNKAKKLGRFVTESTPMLAPVDLISTIQRSIDLVIKGAEGIKVNHALSFSSLDGFKEEGTTDSSDIFVMADEFLDEIFVNLYSNSVKHLKDESSEVTIETKIDLIYDCDPGSSVGSSDSVKISISDNGAGIPDVVKLRLFSRFLNGAKGTGLGMSIVQALVVDRYGGRIQVKDNMLGDHTTGALIEIMLPRASFDSQYLS